MFVGLGMSLVSKLRSGVAAFSPSTLFASGEEGAWYEPSTTTAFTATATGSNGFTDIAPAGYGDLCAILLDKSQGAGYSGGSFTGLGSELVTNGTFDTDTDWTKTGNWTISGGQASSGANSTYDDIQQDVGLVGGAWYFVDIEVVSVSATRFSDRFFFSFGDGDTQSSGRSFASVGITSTGTHTIFVQAGSVDSLLRVYAGGFASIVIDNISVRELPGNHATQGTESARPILARVPPRGRVNELSETDTLATQSVTVTAAQRTLSFTGTGTITLTGASMAGPLVGTGAGDRVSLTFTPSAGTLTLTVLGTVTDAQLELGASATTYQSVADSLGYDITEAGVTSLEYLAFDGSDDSFVILGSQAWYDQYIGSIVIAASTDSTSSQDVVSNRGVDSAGVRGKYALSIRNNGVNWTYDNLVVGSGAATSTASPINTPYVFYGSGDGTNVSSSINSGSVTTATDTYTARGLDAYIGQSGNSGTYFSGRIYGIVLTNDVLTAQEISDTETYLAAKTGVTIP